MLSIEQLQLKIGAGKVTPGYTLTYVAKRQIITASALRTHFISNACTSDGR